MRRWIGVLMAVVTAGAVLARDGPAPAGAGPDGPGALTARRTERGVHLVWSDSRGGLAGIWRGTEPGSLHLLAQIPGGHAGFLDLGAAKDQEYWYALGDAKRPGQAIRVGPREPARILAGLVTTCSGLTRGKTFPADTQNYFTASRDPHVQYFGYFILTPFDPEPRTARLVWRDPRGEVFSESEIQVTPKEVELPGGKAGQVLLAQPIGLRNVLSQNGQKRVPTEPGLHSIEAAVDGVTVGVSVFWIGREGDKAPGQR